MSGSRLLVHQFSSHFRSFRDWSYNPWYGSTWLKKFQLIIFESNIKKILLRVQKCSIVCHAHCAFHVFDMLIGLIFNVHYDRKSSGTHARTHINLFIYTFFFLIFFFVADRFFFIWLFLRSISIKRVGKGGREWSTVLACELKLSKSLMIFCDSAFVLNSCFRLFAFQQCRCSLTLYQHSGQIEMFLVTETTTTTTTTVTMTPYECDVNFLLLFLHWCNNYKRGLHVYCSLKSRSKKMQETK